jgi:hypothetical protein
MMTQVITPETRLNKVLDLLQQMVNQLGPNTTTCLIVLSLRWRGCTRNECSFSEHHSYGLAVLLVTDQGPYGISRMLEPQGTDAIYQDDLATSFVTDALLFVVYSLPESPTPHWRSS